MQGHAARRASGLNHMQPHQQQPRHTRQQSAPGVTLDTRRSRRSSSPPEAPSSPRQTIPPSGAPSSQSSGHRHPRTNPHRGTAPLQQRHELQRAGTCRHAGTRPGSSHSGHRTPRTESRAAAARRARRAAAARPRRTPPHVTSDSATPRSAGATEHLHSRMPGQLTPGPLEPHAQAWQRGPCGDITVQMLCGP